MGTSFELDIANPSGLHARPAAVFVRTAAGFRCDVRVSNLTTGSAEVTAKSIIAVLGLGVQRGHRVRVRTEGDGEADAAACLREIIEGGLGEPVTGESAHPGS